jgi:2-iminobutanoate/2-iminopropanoate deaminase
MLGAAHRSEVRLGAIYMFEVVETGLARTKNIPLNGSVKAGKLVYTSQIPKDPVTAQLIQGDIEVQTRRLLLNLTQSMQAAGGSLADVCQVIVFLTDSADFPGMNRVYTEIFSPPYPNRSVVVVKELLAPGMRIEMVTHAVLGD